ncbi:hypothetical protein IQ265_18695 [Nodosilinea sp. LEGE 06152]|uniref:hypothetical protein n=1 Tax=Nodosilinea sp. LEGE 06152 TaxID=2777966 RepID=UPI00188286F3|nr:hypothetical protein [Nodosilinea sp. LEGE 06152]MBE9158848.1 hypothetical protein [Nodosilinea sp. LEGE 06152]
MKTVRPDSQTAQFYNDGLVIFLYYNQSQAAIKAVSPSILGGYGNSDINAELFEVTEKGLLVAHELRQDDEIALEVAIGNPLSEQERKAVEIYPPVQRAYLNLPSGKLAIEGYGNLRLSPDFDPNEEPGALLDVPPGEYIVSIHNIAGCTEEELKGVSQPNYLFVLTPLSQAEPLPERKPLLHSYS